MTDYAAVPKEYQPPEYNPAGDSANGYAGTVTPGAVSNQVNSSTGGSSSNPYAEILKYLPAPQSAQAIDRSGDLTGASPIQSTPPLGSTPSPDPGPAIPPVTTAGRNRPSAPPIVYGEQNLPPAPDPAKMANSDYAASQYRLWAFRNPAFANITGADVNAYRSNPQGMTIDQWYLAGNRAPTTGITDPHGNPAPDIPGVGAGLPPTPSPTPTGGDGSGTGGTGTGGGPGSGGGYFTPTPTTQPTSPSLPGSSSDYSGILQQLQQLMGGEFDYEHTQLARRMNAQAALLGDFGSGGYQEVSDRAFAQQAGEQGNRLSGYLNTDWQSSLDRAMQKYASDNSLTASRYNSEAAGAAASASAASSRYASDIGLQEARLRDATSRYQGDQGYNLGLAGLGLDRYKFDNPNINALLGMYLQMSPEQLAQFASNPTLFPGFAYTPHP